LGGAVGGTTVSHRSTSHRGYTLLAENEQLDYVTELQYRPPQVLGGHLTLLYAAVLERFVLDAEILLTKGDQKRISPSLRITPKNFCRDINNPYLRNICTFAGTHLDCFLREIRMQGKTTKVLLKRLLKIETTPGRTEEAFIIAQAITKMEFPLLSRALEKLRQELGEQLHNQDSIGRNSVQNPLSLGILSPVKEDWSWTRVELTPEIQRDPNITGKVLSKNKVRLLRKAIKEQVRRIRAL